MRNLLKILIICLLFSLSCGGPTYERHSEEWDTTYFWDYDPEIYEEMEELIDSIEGLIEDEELDTLELLEPKEPKEGKKETVINNYPRSLRTLQLDTVSILPEIRKSSETIVEQQKILDSILRERK